MHFGLHHKLAIGPAAVHKPFCAARQKAAARG